MPDDLLAFLNARYAEGLALVDAVEAEVGTGDAYPSYPWGAQPAELAFMARWHPRTVRADIEAKRGLLEMHAPIIAESDQDNFAEKTFCLSCSWTAGSGGVIGHWPCKTQKLLALPYADHPDYQEAWTP